MANGELADHERALGPNFAVGFERDVHELHRADCQRFMTTPKVLA